MTTIRSFPGHLVLASLLALSLATASAQAPSAAVPAPSASALAGLDAVEAVALGYAWRGLAVTSFVTPLAVHFAFPDGVEVVVPLPADRMLVSVAPYLVHTHPCFTHYLSGCQGELVGEPFRVRATLADGRVLLDEVVPSLDNGFVDLWLPRGASIDVTFELDGYRAGGRLTTGTDSPTCITTLQLSRAGG